MMGIKNLKCYALGAILLVNSSFMISCDSIKAAKEAKKLDEFVAENGMVAIMDLPEITRNYYEAVVSDYSLVGDELVFTEHYERIDDISNVVCEGREFDYDYKVLKIEGSDGDYEITSEYIEDIDLRDKGYDYVYPDDYAYEKGYSNVLIRNGNVLRK